jgi:hypothetical protein
VRQQKLPVWAITIANEPDGGDGNQIPPDGLAYMAHQLAIQLEPFGVRLYGPDTTSGEAAMDYLPALLGDPVVADRLAFVGFHQYSGDPSVAAVADYVRARQPRLPVVVTEYTSCGFGDLDAGHEASDPLGFTLDVADTLLAHYRLGADAALYWDAVDYLQPGRDAITRWGLLRSPEEDFARVSGTTVCCRNCHTFSPEHRCSTPNGVVVLMLACWQFVKRMGMWPCFSPTNRTLQLTSWCS